MCVQAAVGLTPSRTDFTKWKHKTRLTRQHLRISTSHRLDNNYLARLRCLRMTTEGRFSEVFRLLSTARWPFPVLLVIAAAAVFLEPLVLKPCQFSAGSDLRCRAATALLLDLPCLDPAEHFHSMHAHTGMIQWQPIGKLMQSSRYLVQLGTLRHCAASITVCGWQSYLQVTFSRLHLCLSASCLAEPCPSP